MALPNQDLSTFQGTLGSELASSSPPPGGAQMAIRPYTPQTGVTFEFKVLNAHLSAEASFQSTIQGGSGCKSKVGGHKAHN